jgi:hypothetical protein
MPSRARKTYAVLKKRGGTVKLYYTFVKTTPLIKESS